MASFFAVALFVSALLLFLIQPMIAKMILPSLGGTPAAWTMCMVFFQAGLLGGHLYAHVATAWLGLRRQALLHILVLLLPALLLAVETWFLRETAFLPGPEPSPVVPILLLLLISAGLPFVVVSASAPLLQKWFTASGHAARKDPYFLYGTSNLGSMTALLGYPFLVEPFLSLDAQAWLWAAGYVLMVLLVAGCAVALWRTTTARDSIELWKRESVQDAAPAEPSSMSLTYPLSWGRRLRWAVLAFVPSSLMLSVTTHLTTEIASFPPLWAIPLALYLLTFVLVFARKPPVPHRGMVYALPPLTLLLAVLTLCQMREPLWLVGLVHLLNMFVAAMVCHGELVGNRPSYRHLTEFYLWMSAGSMLGGLFNALGAPLLFNSFAEYPIALALACVLLPKTVSEQKNPVRWHEFLLPLVTGGVVAGILWFLEREHSSTTVISALVFLFLLAFCCFTFMNRRLAFGLSIAAMLLVNLYRPALGGRLIHQERSFFGVHRVIRDPGQRYDMLLHDHVVQGMQSLDPARRREPLGSYHRSGPIGQVFAALYEMNPPSRIAVIGLGNGSLTCYAQAGQRWTFYEIDPVVERIARDPFTFLRDSPAAVEVVQGDGRLALQKADGHYGMIIIDVFSSDGVPVHFLTREAMQLYKAKLAERGVLVFHISSRHVELESVLGDLAGDARLEGLAKLERTEDLSEEERKQGKTGSHWAVLVRQYADLGTLGSDPTWRNLEGRPQRVWTDDYANILGALKW